MSDVKHQPWLIHLFSHFRTLSRGDSKATLTCSSLDVWDRDLDQGFRVMKRNG